MSDYLSPSAREALAELAELYGTFLLGRWAEVMADDMEPPDDWQTIAAFEAVDLFAPAAADFLAAHVKAALEAAAVSIEAWQHNAERAADAAATLTGAANSSTRAGAYRRAAAIVRATSPPAS